MHLLRPTEPAQLAREAFDAFAHVAETGSYPPTDVEDDVLRSVVHIVADQDVVPPRERCKRLDPRKIVRACTEYADSVARIPSISELCLAAHVSERCLRNAFVEQFGATPTHYCRAWTLEHAHRRLLRPDRHDLTVTDVATGLGWNHLGRFSVRYREIYGETPSATLRAAAT